MLDQMIASNKGGRRAVSDHAEALIRLGEAQLKAGQLAEARSSADSALSAMREIAAQRPEDSNNVVQALILAGKTNAATGNLAAAESLLHEARDKAQKIARPEELTSLNPLGTAEEALGTFYVQQRRTQPARECYEQLVKLWEQFPESNEYVNRQRSKSKRLLATLH